MNRWWKMLILSVLLSFSFVTDSVSIALANDEPPPSGLTAQGLVLLDMQSGQILYEHNKDNRLYPASITKIMTAILALEHADLDDRVKTSKLAREQEGNRIYLEYDEVQTMENLLYGLMLNSGNDAAVAIAEHVGGSVEEFAEMMNAKAAELGARNTHFVTPSGLHEDDHYTTPYDMALITQYAMQKEKFREIVRTETYEWHGQVWESVLVNLNSMLWNYEGATGVKTGFTDQAQQTIVATAKRGDRELMAVLMGVQNRMTIRLEATALLDYGFNETTLHRLASYGDVLLDHTVDGVRVQGVLQQDVYYTSPHDVKPAVEIKVEPTQLTLPFLKGAKVGIVSFIAPNGEILAQADLITKQDALPMTKEPAESFWSIPVPWVVIGSVVLLGLALLLLRRRRRNRRSASYPRFY